MENIEIENVTEPWEDPAFLGCSNVDYSTDGAAEETTSGWEGQD